MMQIFTVARRIVCRRSVLTKVALVVILWLCYVIVVHHNLDNNNTNNQLREHEEKITNKKAKLIQNDGSFQSLNNPIPEHLQNKDTKLQHQERLKSVKKRFNMTSEIILPSEAEDDTSPMSSPGAGENGQAVNINQNDLSKSERQKFDEGWKNHAFNEYVSRKVSVHRSLPDVRCEECKSVEYPSDLPDTSVIVIFHNEAWTVLLRTVHSVLDRSPPDLIREVILVDDCSTFEHLKRQLQGYVDRHHKLRLVRAPKREGLIRARLLGASVAQGKVLTFLDSHCECTEGWLEPLLSRIHENEHNVVCPVIDAIDPKTFKYKYSISPNSVQVGIFNWNMNFNWMVMPEREKKRRESDADPIRSPTMAGGLFSISKAYFEKLGTYDRGMDFWGGENLEMSFRVTIGHAGQLSVKMKVYKHMIWMCGGILEIHPCSHVGHIFRSRSPYSSPRGKGEAFKNSIRVAEVWMDDYKKYFYDKIGNRLGNYGNITDRVELRKSLKCHTFEWYLNNVFPELFVPSNALASGAIRNRAEPKCLDSPLTSTKKTKLELSTYACHNLGGNQYWMLSQTGEIRRDNFCFDFNGKTIVIERCHGMRGNQNWIYTKDSTIHHPTSNRCIQLSLDGSGIEMASCNKRKQRQIWIWKRKDPAD